MAVRRVGEADSVVASFKGTPVNVEAVERVLLDACRDSRRVRPDAVRAHVDLQLGEFVVKIESGGNRRAAHQSARQGFLASLRSLFGTVASAAKRAKAGAAPPDLNHFSGLDVTPSKVAQINDAARAVREAMEGADQPVTIYQEMRQANGAVEVLSRGSYRIELTELNELEKSIRARAPAGSRHPQLRVVAASGQDDTGSVVCVVPI